MVEPLWGLVKLLSVLGEGGERVLRAQVFPCCVCLLLARQKGAYRMYTGGPCIGQFSYQWNKIPATYS